MVAEVTSCLPRPPGHWAVEGEGPPEAFQMVFRWFLVGWLTRGQVSEGMLQAGGQLPPSRLWAFRVIGEQF